MEGGKQEQNAVTVESMNQAERDLSCLMQWHEAQMEAESRLSLSNSLSIWIQLSLGLRVLGFLFT